MSTRYETWGGSDPDAIVDHLRIRSMKRHYPDFVLEYGLLEAGQKMGNLFGASIWENNKDEIIRWFENDFYRDKDGNVHI